VHLFVCLQKKQPIAAILVSACHGVVQCLLGGCLDEAVKLSPMKLLLDEVRLWATARGLGVFHLGGGTTLSPNDPLLRFKMGFSDWVHDFAVWRCVLRPDVYRELCTKKARWNERHRLRATRPGYFPEYRTPTVATR
jgi:hypothetical protein